MARVKDAQRSGNHDRGLATLREQLGLDAIVVSSPINTHFLTGCPMLTQRLLPDRLALAINTDRGSTFVVCDIEEPQARAESRIADIRGYTEFATSPIALVTSVLGEAGASAGKIGFEGRHLVADFYEEVQASMPGATLIPIDRHLARLRALKSESEIALLREAFSATDRAIATAYLETKPGDSTRRVADRMKRALLENGADEVAFMVIGGGPLTLQGHPRADERPLEPTDPVRVDFGGNFRGYFTDLARSAFSHTMTKAQGDAYRRLWDSLEDTIASISPGVEARQIYATAKVAMEAHGLGLNLSNGVWELPHVGHGIGLGIHEFPMLDPGESKTLEPGMILCVELLYTEPGAYRLHIEDAVVITSTGTEILSRSRDWSEPLALRGG